MILACNQLIEREAHVARATVSVVLHEEARRGGRWYLPHIGARLPRLTSIGLRVLPRDLRRIDPVAVVALRTRLWRARLLHRGRWALRKLSGLPRRHARRLLGHALGRRVHPSLHARLGRVDLQAPKGDWLWGSPH